MENADNKVVTLRARDAAGCPPVTIVWTRTYRREMYEREWTMYVGTKLVISDKNLAEVLHNFIAASEECTKYVLDALDGRLYTFSTFEYALQAFINRTVGQ